MLSEKYELDNSKWTSLCPYERQRTTKETFYHRKKRKLYKEEKTEQIDLYTGGGRGERILREMSVEMYHRIHRMTNEEKDEKRGE